jgi:hypothetical protein
LSVVSAEKLMHSPPGTVFDFVAAHHFENHPRWDPDVLEMNQTSPGNSWRRHKGQYCAPAMQPPGGVNRNCDRSISQTSPRPGMCSSDVSCYATVSSWRRTKVKLRPAYGCQSRREPRVLVRLMVPLLRSRFRKTVEQSLTRIASFLE